MTQVEETQALVDALNRVSGKPKFRAAVIIVPESVALQKSFDAAAIRAISQCCPRDVLATMVIEMHTQETTHD